MLARVRDLEEWMDLGLRSDDSIEPDEWDGLMARVGAFLLTKNPVVIDGKPAGGIFCSDPLTVFRVAIAPASAVAHETTCTIREPPDL